MRPPERHLWVGQWVEALLPGVVRRVLKGAEPQPRWLPRRVLTVVSADIDTTAGVGAVWAVWHPSSARAREHIALMEWHEEQWRCTGMGSGPADDPADVDVLEIRDGAGALSLTRYLGPPDSVSTAPWIGSVKVRVGPGVGHLLMGDRLIGAHEQRELVAAWISAHAHRKTRPLIVAFGRDGTELSRIGPRDGLDTHTWARLRRELP
ncbi:hypothetical protein ACIP4X_02145 [Streptomyces sp. NPDC088817]|uniref:hypothetical protein n=1 Tax=Streptomyces sp. NPDC088817 TaxID=3365907 RepID=UPI003821B163